MPPVQNQTNAFNAPPQAVERAKPFSKPQEQQKEPSIKDIWGKMTTRQRVELLNRPDLTYSDLEYLTKELGITKAQTEGGMTAPPSLLTLAGVKERARNLILKASDWLPSIGAAGGGVAGAAIGTEMGPETVTPTRTLGSALGGAAGEIQRQMIVHDLGQDDPDYTWGQRAADVSNEAMKQGLAEVAFSKLHKMLYPTFEKSIDRIVSIGGLSGASPLGATETQNLELVMDDLLKTEKAGGEVLTIGDFSKLLNQEKKEIGNEVDLSMQQPVMSNGKRVPLRDADATTNPIFNRIHDLLNAHPSEAQGAVGDNPVKRKAIEHRALQYAIPRKFGELTDRRIVLNNELRGFYNLPKNEQQAYLMAHPELEIDKAEADAIRDVIYPQMDIAAGKPHGTTKALQEKRGALISLSKAFDERVGIPATLHAKSREIAGTPWWKRGNFSTYGTTSGRPGVAIHRLGSLIIKLDPEAEADKQTARAFGNTLMTGKYAQRVFSTPGTEIMSLPLRTLLLPKHEKPEGDDDKAGESALHSAGGRSLAAVKAEAHLRNRNNSFVRDSSGHIHVFTDAAKAQAFKTAAGIS